MKSYLSNYETLYDNLTVIKQPVQEVFINSNIDETTLKYYVCTSKDMKHCQVYDYIFLTIGTLSYHDPYYLKRYKRLYSNSLPYI